MYEKKAGDAKANIVLLGMWDDERQSAVAASRPETGDEIAFLVIDYAHNELHKKNYYSASYKSADASPIADNGTLIFAITTGAKESHMEFSGACGGDAEGELLEGSTIANGTPITPRNHNRTGTDTPLTTILRDPTVNADGTRLLDVFIPGGAGGQTTGAISNTRNEWILKPNTIYVARLTNRAGTAQPMSMDVEWYEENVN